MQGADHLRELECSPVMRGDKSGDVPASDFAGQRVVEVVVDQMRRYKAADDRTGRSESLRENPACGVPWSLGRRCVGAPFDELAGQFVGRFFIRQ